MANELASKFFWSLDNEIPTEVVRGYQGALQAATARGKDNAALARAVKLLDSKVPTPPRAYLTSAALDAAEGRLPGEFIAELERIMARLERLSGKKLGGRERPLLLTIQGDYCGAIRNLGCTPKTLRALIHDLGAPAAYSLYVDFLESFSSLALSCPHIDFRSSFNLKTDREGGAGGLAALNEDSFAQRVQEYQNLVSQKIRKPFPESPQQQLLAALIHAARAGKGAGGDEIFVKAQAVKTLDSRSMRGVAYTRNPFTGKKDLYGVFQAGEDAQKWPIEPPENAKPNGHDPAADTLRERFPTVHSSLKRYLPLIEAAYRDVVEAEFVTDADGHLFFTGFDKGETTTRASLTTAIDLNLEGRISDQEAVARIKPKDVEVMLHPTLDEASRARLTDVGVTGVSAAPGTAIGAVFFKMADAIDFYRSAGKNKQSKHVILMADELLISDTPGLGIISGLVTKASGIASHAAVMARANGIPCIVGLGDLTFSPDGKSATINGKQIQAGTEITLEAGANGKLYIGRGTLQNLSFQEGIVRDVAQLVTRVIKKEGVPLEVRVNINGAKDAETGLSFGADGVGLCRTENMFMEPEALREIRNIVFTRDPEKCSDSFAKLEETQFRDFQKIFQVMRERTVNIRLMDLPLHDLVPQREEDFEALVKSLPHLSREHLREASEELREHNPMLGLRACRFGLITPQVYNMQIRAIVRAAYSVAQNGTEVNPGIMFPLVFSKEELSRLRDRVIELEAKVREEMKIPFGTKIHFKVGSMIELPAAALSTDQLARIGEFFAFGTNDLTQTTLGMSRDDSAHYLPAYLEKGLIPADPFKVLCEPVKELVLTAVQRGHRARADVSFGICGEQGGDPATLRFCLERGINYVSCSPFRVLPVRVALVHAALAFLRERKAAAARAEASRANARQEQGTAA